MEQGQSENGRVGTTMPLTQSSGIFTCQQLSLMSKTKFVQDMYSQ